MRAVEITCESLKRRLVLPPSCCCMICPRVSCFCDSTLVLLSNQPLLLHRVVFRPVSSLQTGRWLLQLEQWPLWLLHQCLWSCQSCQLSWKGRSVSGRKEVRRINHNCILYVHISDLCINLSSIIWGDIVLLLKLCVHIVKLKVLSPIGWFNPEEFIMCLEKPCAPVVNRSKITLKSEGKICFNYC